MWIDSGNSGTYSIFDQYFTWIVVCMILSILGFFLSESGLLICYVVGLGFRKIALMFNCIPKSQKQDSEPSTPNQKSKPCFDITADQVRFQNKAQQYQQSTIFAPNTQLFSSNSNSSCIAINIGTNNYCALNRERANPTSSHPNSDINLRLDATHRIDLPISILPSRPSQKDRKLVLPAQDIQQFSNNPVLLFALAQMRENSDMSYILSPLHLWTNLFLLSNPHLARRMNLRERIESYYHLNTLNRPCFRPRNVWDSPFDRYDTESDDDSICHI